MNDLWSVLVPWAGLIGLLWFVLVVSRKRSRPGLRTGRYRRRAGAPRPPGKRFPKRPLAGRVLRVKDGDSLVAEISGFGRLQIRLAYVDAPEHDQPWGQESKVALSRLLQGARPQFRLLYRDKFARAVAIVSVKGVVCNEHLVREGHAWVYHRHLPGRLRNRYRRLQRTAQGSGAGLWGVQAQPVPPWVWRHKGDG